MINFVSWEFYILQSWHYFEPHAADFHQAFVLIYLALLTISRLFTLPYFLFRKIIRIKHLPGLTCLGSHLALDSEHLQPRWPPVEQSAPYISMILRKNGGLQTGALRTSLIVQLLAGSFFKKKTVSDSTGWDPCGII